ncbi:MAG: DUF349 domain-containing protein [Desulfobulbaceae bacterium]|nr:DUF349 domain-containing protein [Desulfobulbaceae bacterium]
MGLLNFRKPKWHHKDPAVRLESIDSIDPRETEVLAGLSLEDQDRQVRLAAINRLTDLATLEQLAPDADPQDLPFIIARKDQLLYDLVLDAPGIDDCHNDLNQITSAELLAKIAVNSGHPEIRLAAVMGIDDQLLLAAIVEENCGKEPARVAMAKINGEELLTRLAKNAASKTARRLAATKLADIERQRHQPDQEELLDQALLALADEATKLLNSGNIDEAAARLSAIKHEWQQLDSTANHPAYSVLTKTCNDFADKFQEIQARRQKEQEKSARYARQQTRLDEICATIEQLTGSTDQDAEMLKKQATADWASLLADPDEKLAPSATMTNRFTKACQAFDSKREKIRSEKELIDVIEKNCAETKELIAAANLKNAAVHLATTEKKLAAIKFKYFKQAASQKLVSAVSADLAQAQKELHDKNLARQREICAELESLATTEKNSRAEQQLQTLQEAWRQLPTLNDAEGKDLAQRFQNAVADFTDKRQIFQHEQDWQLWANLGLKEKLTARIAALDQQEDLETVVKVIKESQAEWKTVGPVPARKAQKLWDKFHSGCNRNFQRAEPYLVELRNRQAEAMVRRREICLLAAELAKSTAWQKTAAALKDLQGEWQALLPGSRREERQLYQQFREACNQFFERRQENYQSKASERQQHLLDKEKLCEEAERLAAEPQADYARKFRDLQSQWQKIGHVPRDQQEAIWQRFRAACDSYFNWISEQQQQNLKRKEELCEKVETLLAETTEEGAKQEIAAKLTEMQQQWQEIGPVPRDQSEAIWQRFQGPCDSFFKARLQQVKKEEKKRRLNQIRKEELLAQAVELACQEKDKKITEQLQELQKDWAETGSAPREIDKKLDGRFQDLCDAFFAGRHQYFADLKEQHLANQKKKESLCLRLENILGTAHKSVVKGRGKALSLAEELKQAMQDNFMLAGRRNEKKSIDEEIKRIEQDWQNIGSVPYKQVRPLTERFEKSLDSYYKKQRD